MNESETGIILKKEDLLIPYTYENPMGGSYSRRKLTPLMERLRKHSTYNREKSVGTIYSNDCYEVTWNNYHIELRVIDDGDCFSVTDYDVNIKLINPAKPRNMKLDINGKRIYKNNNTLMDRLWNFLSL